MIHVRGLRTIDRRLASAPEEQAADSPMATFLTKDFMLSALPQAGEIVDVAGGPAWEPLEVIRVDYIEQSSMSSAGGPTHTLVFEMEPTERGGSSRVGAILRDAEAAGWVRIKR